MFKFSSINVAFILLLEMILLSGGALGNWSVA